MRHGVMPQRDPDIDWWVNDAAADMGHTGTLQAVISQLERGGPGSGSGSNPDHVTDRQLAAVRRYARVEAVWLRLDAAARRVLRCYYEHRQLAQGVREELGSVAGVAAMQANDDGHTHVADACAKLHQRPTSWRDTEAGRIALQVVTSARLRAEDAAVKAHQALAVARGSDAAEWLGGGA